MQTANQAPPSARLWWIKLSVAGLAAASAVVIAGVQIASSGRPQHSGTPATLIPPRGAAPEFWLTDYASGRTESRNTGKPIFLVIRCEP